MKLHRAFQIWERIRDVLSPHCDQIEVAGSVRRARPVCNDIDIVLQPRGSEGMDAVLSLCHERAAKWTRNGADIATMILKDKEATQVDIFFAAPPRQQLIGDAVPGNWGSVLLCRTGSKEHNIKIAQAAKALRLHWKITQGIVRLNPNAEVREVIASETEEDIFRALNMEFIAPVDREVPGLRS
jgi:DNA polymerase (family X)